MEELDEQEELSVEMVPEVQEEQAGEQEVFLLEDLSDKIRQIISYLIPSLQRAILLLMQQVLVVSVV